MTLYPMLSNVLKCRAPFPIFFYQCIAQYLVKRGGTVENPFEKIYDGEPILAVFSNIGEDVQYRCFQLSL
jgi:hypothetical protein